MLTAMDTAAVLARNDRYLREFVEAFQICPFARSCRERGGLWREVLDGEGGGKTALFRPREWRGVDDDANPFFLGPQIIRSFERVARLQHGFGAHRVEAFAAEYAVVDDKALQRADRWIGALRARGGTEMLPALRAALDGETPAGRLRTVLFVTDGTASLTDADHEALKLLRRSGRPVIYVANKADSASKAMEATDLYRAGADRIVAVSALHGRGVAPAAYLLSWGERQVLLSGRILAGTDQASLQQLREELPDRRAVEDFQMSLERLSEFRPDLWLPAVPAQGQNANLYDRAWREVLVKNLSAVNTRFPGQ